MIICHKHRFVFVKTRKTASTSVEVLLSQYCGDADVLTPINPPIAPHIPRNYQGPWNPLPDLLYFRGRYGLEILRAFRNGLRFHNHMPAGRIRRHVDPEIWNGYFKFCVERNPWDKTVSHYYFGRRRSRGRITFDEYMRRERFCVDWDCYTDMAGKLIVDRVIKYENLEQDLKDVLAGLGIQSTGTLDVRAKSNHRQDGVPYQRLFSNVQRLQIQKAFRREIALLEYTF